VTNHFKIKPAITSVAGYFQNTIKKTLFCFGLPVLVLCSEPVLAQSNVAQCFAMASNQFDIPLELLIAVKHVESGSRLDTGIIHTNTNGTSDLGIMQINSTWLPRLAEFGVTAEDLLTDHCVNIAVGAWILADAIAKTASYAEALSMYNTGRAWSIAGKRYTHRVEQVLTRMLASN